MCRINSSLGRFFGISLSAAAATLLAATSSWAQSDAKTGDAKPGDKPIIRIRAGSDRQYKASKGNTLLGDKMTKDGGFEGGETIDRPEDMKIENTKDPDLYRTERYSMDSFWWKLPNGKYIVKLHFAETYDGIGGV